MKKSITVFCASNDGNNPAFAEAARLLGKTMAQQGRKLIYGAGNRGLMGVVAKSALEHGGTAVGINLSRFQNPKYMMDVNENYMTETIQDRKLQLIERSEASIALPGGLGTLDELLEVLTMLQLKLTTRPVAILNVDGFYDDLLRFFDKMVDVGFVKEKHKKFLIVRDSVEGVLSALDNYDQEPGEA